MLKQALSSSQTDAIRIRQTVLNMFYLLFICSCLIVCSEIPFSESLCFIGASQFISSIQYLTRFCFMWDYVGYLRTHLRVIFVLCVSFYEPAFAIIYLTAIRFSIIDVSGYQEGFHLFVFDAG